MEVSNQSKIRNLVMEYLADGRVRTTAEMKGYLAERGVIVEPKSSALRTSLHLLRKDGKLVSRGKGEYQRCDVEPAAWPRELAQKYHFEEYDVICEKERTTAKYVVTVKEDGFFTVSAGLLKCFPQKKAVIRLRKDGKGMLLMEEGEGQLSLNRSGRSKKPEVVKRLQALKYSFPVVYEGEWVERDQIWVGEWKKVLPQSAGR